MNYIIETTYLFEKSLKKLDKNKRNNVYERLNKIENGNLGDYKSLGENLFELRIFKKGSISRIYYTIRNNIIILLLNVGEKDDQQNDIKNARELLELLTKK